MPGDPRTLKLLAELWAGAHGTLVTARPGAPAEAGVSGDPRTLKLLAELWAGAHGPLVTAVLQMAFCARRSRQVLPEAASSRSTQVSPPRLSRVNGWSRPLHPFQIMAWTVFLILAFTTFGVFIPLLPRDCRYIAYSVSFSGAGQRCGLGWEELPEGPLAGLTPPAGVVRPASTLAPMVQPWFTPTTRTRNPTAARQWLLDWGPSCQCPPVLGRGRAPGWWWG